MTLKAPLRKRSQRRGKSPSLRCNSRTRRSFKEVEVGNNRFGRNGTLRCEQCRRRNSKVYRAKELVMTLTVHFYTQMEAMRVLSVTQYLNSMYKKARTSNRSRIQSISPIRLESPRQRYRRLRRRTHLPIRVFRGILQTSITMVCSPSHQKLYLGVRRDITFYVP